MVQITFLIKNEEEKRKLTDLKESPVMAACLMFYKQVLFRDPKEN